MNENKNILVKNINGTGKKGGRQIMITTLDLPEKLVEEAMVLTRIQNKTDLIKIALQNLIQKEKIKELKKYYGKIDLEIDLDTIRNR